MLYVKPLKCHRIPPDAWDGNLRKYRLFEHLIMRTGVMNMLGRIDHGLCHVDVKLEFIRKYHDCPRLANAMAFNDKVLIGPATEPNKDAITPSNALTGNSTFSGSSLVAQSLPEEW